jgi:tRNA-dihydrouridine synthase A
MRIGIIDGAKGALMRERLATYDEHDYARLVEFTTAVTAAGCEVFIVHARQAVLGGLSPKENRDVPPLRPQIVRRLKEQFPALCMVVNGGFRTVPQVLEALGWCDGVMLGREAYHRPYLLSELHRRIMADGWARPGEGPLLERMCAYAEREMASGTPLAAITRHMFGLYAGQAGARNYRYLLSAGVRAPGAGVEVLRAAKLISGPEVVGAAEG